MRVGLGADGVLGDLVGVDAAGRVAAVEDVLAAGGVGVAVVAALLESEEEVVLGAGTSDGAARAPGCRRGRARGVLPPAAEPLVGA